MTIANIPLDELRAAPEFSAAELVAILSTLVRCRSVNPGVFEAGMVEECRKAVAPTGCEIEEVEFAPGRPSLAAVLRGSGDGPRLVLNGHMDTVSIDDSTRWHVDPFGGVVRDGAVWGRGAADMKGGLVTQIACARFLARHRDRLKGTLVLHFAAGEECGEPGTQSLVKRGYTGDWGIVLEPTNLAVATAMRGVVWYSIRLAGASTHASSRQSGKNPILQLGNVLAVLDRCDAGLEGRRHPLMGIGTLTPTMIRAGVEHNAVPDGCEIVVDRRMIAGETPEGILAELRRLVSEAVDPSSGITSSVEIVHHPFLPVEIPEDSPFVKGVKGAFEAVTGKPPRIESTPYSSDIRNLVYDAGMEAITFGAGDISKCHAPDERIEIADLRTATLVIARVATELLW